MKKIAFSFFCIFICMHSTIQSMTADVLQKIDQSLITFAKVKAQEDPTFDWLPSKINMLIKNSDVNAFDDLGNTRLHYAAFLALFPAMNLLVRFGANPAKLNLNGQDPLEILEVLLQLQKGNPEKQKELMAGIKSFLEVIAKKNPQQHFKDNRTLLHEAIFVSDLPLIQQLAAYPDLINAPDNTLNTPLHSAALNYTSTTGNQIIEMLIKSGAQVDALNNRQETPLILFMNVYIADKFNPEMRAPLEMLIAHARNINIQDDRGNTALYLLVAALKDTKPDDPNYKLVEYLLRKGANPNIQNKDGFTPLHAAVAHVNGKLVTLLLKYGANPFIRSYEPRSVSEIQKGITPLPNKTPRDMAEDILKGMPENALTRLPLTNIIKTLGKAEQRNPQLKVGLPEPTTIPQPVIVPTPEPIAPEPLQIRKPKPLPELPSKPTGRQQIEKSELENALNQLIMSLNGLQSAIK